MKCDNEAVRIEFLSYQHQKEERNKKWRPKWPTLKFETTGNVSSVWSTGSRENKKDAWASLGVQVVGHASRLWWHEVCDICKFRPTRIGIKGIISPLLLLLLHLLLHSRIVRTSVLTRQVREREGVSERESERERVREIVRERERGPVASS